MEISTDTKCVLCGRSDVATLTIPQKGTVCLTCIRSLNSTVEELVGATQKSTVEMNGHFRVDGPTIASPSVAEHISSDFAEQFSPLTLMHSANGPQYPEVHPLVPRPKSKSAAGFWLQVFAGGLAGLFIGLMILHFAFGIDLWKQQIPKKNGNPYNAQLSK